MQSVSFTTFRIFDPLLALFLTHQIEQQSRCPGPSPALLYSRTVPHSSRPVGKATEQRPIANLLFLAHQTEQQRQGPLPALLCTRYSPSLSRQSKHSPHQGPTLPALLYAYTVLISPSRQSGRTLTKALHSQRCCTLTPPSSHLAGRAAEPHQGPLPALLCTRYSPSLGKQSKHSPHQGPTLLTLLYAYTALISPSRQSGRTNTKAHSQLCCAHATPHHSVSRANTALTKAPHSQRCCMLTPPSSHPAGRAAEPTPRPTPSSAVY
nr:PREDICTED: uncharacterized protein LOC106705544 [Latimeria chalumnae]|eukprot:XP_014350664.1 PREDICTED: uncharacterized protein LOC106705544 [Latimeria chalumnae]